MKVGRELSAARLVSVEFAALRVDVELSPRAPMRDDVLERFELGEMRPHLEVRPPGEIAHRAPREVHVGRGTLLTRARLLHELREEGEELPRLRRQLRNGYILFGQSRQWCENSSPNVPNRSLF